MSRISLRAMGSRPVVGSSRMRILGSLIRALGQADALAHALGIAAQQAAARAGHADEFKHAINTLFQLRAPQAIEFAVVLQNFFPAQEIRIIGRLQAGNRYCV